jgi:4-amino-4-deoxy-L-arabinose transferase-like glycosyltransferase
MKGNANIEPQTPHPEHSIEQASQLSRSTPDLPGSIFDHRNVVRLLAVLLAGLFIYGFRLGASPLDRTEPFRALVAHQMVRGGSWLLPRLYGELYLRKPPLIYWIEAGTEKLFGRGDEWVWRLPSAAGSALLAVFVASWSGRWFGRRAVLPAGFACLALVALWDQDRGADIDALNTAFATVTSLCVLELVCGSDRARAGWCLAMGISLGATLLLKGPGGVPQVVGAIIGPAIFLRDWKRVRQPTIIIGFLIGFAIFAIYVIAAKMAMHHAQITPDKTGWYEVIEKIFFHGWKRRLFALLMPAELLAFALPVSVVLPFAVVLIRQMPVEDLARVRVTALLGTLAASLVIWMLDGNDNPRYEYVMLPLLAPVAGFVWAAWKPRKTLFLPVLIGVAVLVGGAAAGIAMKIPGVKADGLVLIAVSVSLLLVSAMIVMFFAFKELAAKSAGPGVVVLLLLLAVVMGERKNAERRRKSSANAAAQLRGVIGDASRVSAAGVVRDLPELFYYAGVDVDSYGEFGLPRLCAARGGHWVVISENERYPAYSTIKKYIPGAFPRGITKLHMPDPRDQIYVGWYDPPPSSDTRIEWDSDKTAEPKTEFGNDD